MYHQHRMSFHWDIDIGEFLFPGLNITGVPALIYLCLVIGFVCILYEGIKVYQTKVRARTARERQRSVSCAPSETANLIAAERQNPVQHTKFSTKLLTVAKQAVVFLFQTTLGYVLMLVVMVYNGYVFLIVVLSLGLGYFFFGHISMRLNMENIRARKTNVICSSKFPPGDALVDPSCASTSNQAQVCPASPQQAVPVNNTEQPEHGTPTK